MVEASLVLSHAVVGFIVGIVGTIWGYSLGRIDKEDQYSRMKDYEEELQDTVEDVCFMSETIREMDAEIDELKKNQKKPRKTTKKVAKK